MVLVELIVQGLNASTAPIKIPLKEGLNHLKTPDPTFGDTILEIILSLLYSPTPLIAQLIRQQKKIRAGLSFQSDKITYRLVKDLHRNAATLGQFDGDQNQFTELSRDEKFIQHFLENKIKLPLESSYQQLFCLGGKRYADNLNSAVASTAPAANPTISSMSPEERMTRLKTLKQQLQMHDHLQTYELRLDELTQLMFEKDQVLKQIEQKENALRALETQTHAVLSADAATGLPEDIEAKLLKYKKSQAARLADLSRLESKAEGKLADYAALGITPIHKNPLLIAGVALFLLAMLLSVVFEGFRIIAIGGVVVSIGLIAAGFIIQLAKQEKQRSLQSHINQLDYEKKSIEKKYEIDMALVEHLLKRLQLKEPDEILSLVRDRNSAKNQLKHQQEEFAAYKNQVHLDKVRAELKDLQKQGDEVRRHMAELGATPIDPLSLRNEMAALEEEMGSGAGALNLESVAASASEPLQPLLEQAAAQLKLGSGALLSRIHAGLDTNLAAISNRRLLTVNLKDERIVGFAPSKTAKPRSWLELMPQERFYGLFALHFTLLQVLSQHHLTQPVVLSDLEDSWTPNFALVFKALKHLSANAQIILLQSSSSFATLQPPDLVL